MKYIIQARNSTFIMMTVIVIVIITALLLLMTTIILITVCRHSRVIKATLLNLGLR